MKLNLKFFIFIVTIMAFAVLTSVPARALVNDGVAVVVSINGKAEVKARKKGWRKAQVDQKLFVGDLLRTRVKSRMGIRFKDNTQVRLSENSLLKIKDYQTKKKNRNKGVIFLSKGKIRAIVSRARKTAGSGRFEIETYNTVAAVRGTDFTVELTPAGDTLVSVISGIVDVLNKAFPEDITGVRAGFSIIVPKRTRPLKPKSFDIRKQNLKEQWYETNDILEQRIKSLPTGATLEGPKDVILQDNPTSSSDSGAKDSVLRPFSETGKTTADTIVNEPVVPTNIITPTTTPSVPDIVRIPPTTAPVVQTPSSPAPPTFTSPPTAQPTFTPPPPAPPTFTSPPPAQPTFTPPPPAQPTFTPPTEIVPNLPPTGGQNFFDALPPPTGENNNTIP